MSNEPLLLNIPHIKQPENSYRCGAVCLEMLFDHLGMHVDQDVIWNAVSAKVDTPYKDCRINKMVLFARNHDLDAVAVSSLYPLKIVETCLQLGIYPILRYRPVSNSDCLHFSLAVGYSDAGIYLNDPLLDASEGKGRIIDRFTLQQRMNPLPNQNFAPRMVILIAPHGQELDMLPVKTHANGSYCTEHEPVFSCLSSFNPVVLCAKHDRFIASTIR